MIKLPRLLPLVAIAAGGVLAINALENGPGIFGAARAFAESVAKPAKGGKPDAALPADASAASNSAQPQGQAAVAAAPAPVCAESPTELAKAAGLSPAELQVIQSLGARRGELDAREQGLSTQLALLQAAEQKVDERINTLNALKTDMQGLLGQLDDKQQAEVDRLVKVFEGMKPQDAAARFSLLTDDVRLPIAAKMKERALSAMLAKMSPDEAKRLTESLAARYVAQANAARAAINPQAAPPPTPPPAAAAQAATPPAAKPPTQTAAATPAASPAAASAAAPAKPAAHRKPHRPAPAATAAAQPDSASHANPIPPIAPAPQASAAPAAAAPAASTAAAPAKPG